MLKLVHVSFVSLFLYDGYVSRIFPRQTTCISESGSKLPTWKFLFLSLEYFSWGPWGEAEGEESLLVMELPVEKYAVNTGQAKDEERMKTRAVRRSSVTPPGFHTSLIGRGARAGLL